MRVHRMFPVAVAGIVLLCTATVSMAQGFLGGPVLQPPSRQMTTLPQYRVDPVPPAPYVTQEFVAPSYPAYGSSFDSRSNQSHVNQTYVPPRVNQTYVPPRVNQTYVQSHANQAYGQPYVNQSNVDQSQPGGLVPTPAQLGSPALGGGMQPLAGGLYPDRMSQLETDLEMLKSAMDQRTYSSSLRGRNRPGYTPWHTGPYADVAFVFARPWFTDSSNYGIYDAPLDLSTASSFDYDYELTPRMTLGYIGPCGRGVRARYWQFDHAGQGRSVTQTDPNIFYGADWIHPWGMITAMTTGVGETMTISNSIKAQAFDLEATQTMNFGWTEIMFGGGLRYAYLEKKFDAVIPGVDFLKARHDFEGVGPTFSMDVRLPIGYCEGLGLYGGGRYSIMFGRSWAYGENGTDPFDYVLDEVMSIGEIEIGLEWTRSVACMGLFVFRAGYEGQVWYEAGSPSNVGGDLGFEGFNVKLGFIR